MLTYAALAFALVFPAEDPTIAETRALLHEVEAELRATEGPWSPEQAARRAALLDELRAYADAGVFPHNHTHDDEVPVFIDEHGAHCAVAYLILASGHGALAAEVARTDNQLRLPAAHAGIEAWAETHGFTVDELSRVQRPGYRPRPKEPSLSSKGVRTPSVVAVEKRKMRRALDRCVASPSAKVMLTVDRKGRVTDARLLAPEATARERRCVKAAARMASFKAGGRQRIKLSL